MTVSKRKKSPFYMTRFTISYVDSFGNNKTMRIQESTKTVCLKEAKRYEELRKQQLKDELVYGKKPKHTWQQAADRWLKEMHHKRTINQDKNTFKFIIENFQNVPVEDTAKENIENLATVRETGVSAATVNRTLALIKSVLNRSYKHWGWIEKVPNITMRKENSGRIRWETRENMRRLLGHLPHHLRILAEISLATGLRASNVKGMRWEWIDLERHTLTVPASQFKTGKTHSIPLNKIAMDIILAQRNRHPEFVFLYRGCPIKQCSTRAWRNALIKAEIADFRWHDLRHTWASWHIQNGTSLQELQALGGWASFDMVLRYAHLSVDNLKKAAERVS